MSNINDAKLCLSRRNISSLAASLKEETGLSHSKLLDAIAHATGYTGGNALMGSLKNAEAEAVKACAAGECDGYYYEATVSFISDEFLGTDLNLDQIDYDITDGAAVGGPIKVTCTPIRKHELGRISELYGISKDFFPCFQGDKDDPLKV